MNKICAKMFALTSSLVEKVLLLNVTFSFNFEFDRNYVFVRAETLSLCGIMALEKLKFSYDLRFYIIVTCSVSFCKV